MTLVLAGGGSGGHVYPIRSLLQYAYHINYQGHIIRCGTQNSMEERIFHEWICENPSIPFSFRFVGIMSGKRRRQGGIRTLIHNCFDCIAVLIGLIQSIRYLIRYKVTTVFCKGGYAALPVVLAAALLRRRIIVHESDRSAGLVNTIASRFAQTVFSGFPDVLPRSVPIGQILSTDIIQGDETITKQLRNWIDNRHCIMVFGGSLGSQSIYDAIYTYLQKNQNENRCWIVIGGTLSSALNRETFDNVMIFDTCTQRQMGSIYTCADSAIMRAGTTSLAEAQIHGLYKIIIPLTITHDQKLNAQYYVDHYHDTMIDQNDNNRQQNLTDIIIQTPHTKKKHHGPISDDKRHRVWSAIVGEEQQYNALNIPNSNVSSSS